MRTKVRKTEVDREVRKDHDIGMYNDRSVLSSPGTSISTSSSNLLAISVEYIPVIVVSYRTIQQQNICVRLTGMVQEPVLSLQGQRLPIDHRGYGTLYPRLAICFRSD